MITSLSKLKMSQYIELVCGDTSVLHKRGEVVLPAKLEETRARIMYEYAELSNEASARAYISKREKRERVRMELLLFQVCNNLYALQAFDECRQVLIEYGINARNFDNKRLFDEISRLLKRAETERKRIKETPEEKEEMPPADEIRKSFDRQTASLMTYFKFQIDLNKITASQYACMIDQANKEIRAKINAMSKR